MHLAIIISLIVMSGCTSSPDASAIRPDWIDKGNSLEMNNEYMTAVGQGRQRARATDNAVANLLASFSVNVRAESKVVTEAIKNESALGVTMESSTTLLRSITTETDQAIQGVEISETWLSPEGEYYALAILHKRNAAHNLTDSIMRLDTETADLIDYSINLAPNSILSLNALRSARDLQVARQMSNLQLKHISGHSIPEDISAQQVEQLIRDKLTSLSISLADKSEAYAVVLESGLSSLGIKTTEKSALQISGKVTLTEPSYINDWYWLQGSYEVTLTEHGQVISRKRWPLKVSSLQAELLSTRLADKIAHEMAGYLQAIMSDAPSP